MRFSFCHDRPVGLAVDLLALGLFEEACERALFEEIDRALAGALAALVEQEQFKAKADQSLLLHTLGRLAPARVLLVGLGKREGFEVPDCRRLGASASQAALRCRARSLAVEVPAFDARASEHAVQFLVEGLLLGRYRFERYKSKDARSEDLLEQAMLLADSEHPLAVARGELVAGAVGRARDLVNEPASALTPSALAQVAQGLAEERGLELKVLGPKECERHKLRLLLAVGRGSGEEPRFIHLTYRPRGKEPARRRFVLVGKGVTFDSGGLSLKPSASMADMKADMAGAAAVLSATAALAEFGAQAEVHALVPAVENMPSGVACKIGDIVTGLGGKSVEIANTDAEGRLILADALAYGAKLAPDEMIDVATLTGGCVVALGPHIAGVMGSDRAGVERLLAAGRRAGEDLWPLPLPERLKEQLKSPLADLKNSGERWGAALIAGLFLREFAGNVPWLHLDIAGPAYAEKDWGHVPKGGTGFGVATLIEYVGGRD
jgi:leucyl aminopeptidase